MKTDDKFRQATEAYRAKDFGRAARLCKQAIAAAPRFAPAFHLQGILAREAEDYPTAIRALRRAIALDERNLDYHRELLFALGRANHMAEAYDAVRAAAAKLPDSGEAFELLGRVAWGRGYLPEATEAYRKEVALRPTPGAIGRLCAVLAEVGDLDGCLAHADALRQSGWDEIGTMAVACAHLAKGDLERALQVANQPPPAGQGSPRFASLRADLALHATLRKQFPLTDPPRQPADMAVLDDYAARIRDAIPADCAAEMFVVFFHVTQPGAHAATAGHDAAADYHELLSLAAAAARHTVPKVKVVLFTDPDTRVPDGLGLDHVIRLPFRREWIMYERMRAQRAFAASGRMTANTLFLDTDVLIVRDFAELFAEDFDVGLTWRADFPWIPVNGGMILARAARPAKVTAFFDGCLIAYDAMAATGDAARCYGYDIREFQGDQLAMVAFLNWRTPPVGPATLVVEDITVRFFACEDMNCTFRATFDPAVTARKYALHFKGPTKKHARDYVRGVR